MITRPRLDMDILISNFLCNVSMSKLLIWLKNNKQKVNISPLAYKSPYTSGFLFIIEESLLI